MSFLINPMTKRGVYSVVKYADEAFAPVLKAVQRIFGASRQVVQDSKPIFGVVQCSKPISTTRTIGHSVFINSAKLPHGSKIKPVPVIPDMPRVPGLSRLGGGGSIESIEYLESKHLKETMEEIAKMAKGDKTVKTQEYYDKLFEEIDNVPWVGGKKYYNPRTGNHIEVYKKDSPELIKVSKTNSGGGYDKMETLYDWSGADLGLVKSIKTTKEFNGRAYNSICDSRLQLFDPKEGKFQNLHIDRKTGQTMAAFESLKADKLRDDLSKCYVSWTPGVTVKSLRAILHDEWMAHEKLADSLNAYFG